MSYSDARSHFVNASQIANGLKHLSHTLEENIRTLETDIRNLQSQRTRNSSSIVQNR
jgi:hypothetical protein